MKQFVKNGTIADVNKSNFLIGDKLFSAKNIKPSFDSLASDDSGRTDDGVMHIFWIKQNLRKWEIELPPCDSETCAQLLQLVQGKDYQITIFDILTNSTITTHVYTSSSTGDCYSGVLYGGLYKGVTFNAMEIGD